MNERDLKRFFQANKADIPDDGFSQKVMENLPRNTSSLMPLITICGSLLIAFLLLLTTNSLAAFYRQITEMALSISMLQLPTLSSFATYLTGVLIIGSISFAIYQSDSA